MDSNSASMIRLSHKFNTAVVYLADIPFSSDVASLREQWLDYAFARPDCTTFYDIHLYIIADALLSNGKTIVEAVSDAEAIFHLDKSFIQYVFSDTNEMLRPDLDRIGLEKAYLTIKRYDTFKGIIKTTSKTLYSRPE